MKSYKLMIVAGVLLLTACQVKQPLPESRPADTETVTSEAFIPEETDIVESATGDETASEVTDSSAVADTARAATEPGGDYGVQDVAGTWNINGQKTEEANEEPLPAAKVPVIPQSDTSYEGYPKQIDYDSIKALAIEPVKEEEGVYAGSPAIWSTMNDGKFLHFYYTLTYPEKLKPEHAGYAIIGEDVKLACGLHVGMTDKEAEAIIPGLYHFKWENPEYHSVLDWNANIYPDSWCRQFPQILIAEIEDGNELPLIIGLMLDDQSVIRAIAFNNPTAG